MDHRNSFILLAPVGVQVKDFRMLIRDEAQKTIYRRNVGEKVKWFSKLPPSIQVFFSAGKGELSGIYGNVSMRLMRNEKSNDG